MTANDTPKPLRSQNRLTTKEVVAVSNWLANKPDRYREREEYHRIALDAKGEGILDKVPSDSSIRTILEQVFDLSRSKPEPVLMPVGPSETDLEFHRRLRWLEQNVRGLADALGYALQ